MHAPFLKKGDLVRIVTPARSLMLPWMTHELKLLAHDRLEALGLRVTYGRYVNENDEFNSTTIEHRIEDLHTAFADSDVKLILTVIGGYNSNQLLNSLDYKLIQANPKRLCGFSDITALSNAIYAKTGLVTYSGPHFFNFGQKNCFEYTLDSFFQCHFVPRPYAVKASETFVDLYWSTNQDHSEYLKNPGWKVLQEGEAQGTIIGGNLCTFSLLQGTQFMPAPAGDVILFIEEDSESMPHTVDRDLQSLLHQPIFKQVRGIVFGRFQRAGQMTPELFHKIITSKSELRGLPIISDVDFGHTTPMITFPIGGTAQMIAQHERPRIEILSH